MTKKRGKIFPSLLLLLVHIIEPYESITFTYREGSLSWECTLQSCQGVLRYCRTSFTQSYVLLIPNLPLFALVNVTLMYLLTLWIGVVLTQILKKDFSSKSSVIFWIQAALMQLLTSEVGVVLAQFLKKSLLSRFAKLCSAQAENLELEKNNSIKDFSV